MSVSFHARISAEFSLAHQVSGYSVVGQGVCLGLEPRVGQRAGDVPLEVQQSLLHRSEIGRGQQGRNLRLNRILLNRSLEIC